MGYTYYRYDAFIPAANPLTFDALVQLFRDNILKSLVLDVVPDKIIIKHGEWSMRVHWESKRYILEDAREMASSRKLAPDVAALLATCDRRIYIAGDDDPGMDYFNDCVFVLETLNLLEGILRRDLSGEFVDQFGDI
jgi:hypothetical protein